jgi:hypothetical protein
MPPHPTPAPGERITVPPRPQTLPERAIKGSESLIGGFVDSSRALCITALPAIVAAASPLELLRVF